MKVRGFDSKYFLNKLPYDDNTFLLIIFDSTVSGFSCSSSHRFSRLESRYRALEEDLQQSQNRIADLLKLCTAMKSESNWKDSSHDEYKRKMKDFKDTSNDCIWELQDQLRNVNSNYFLEQQKSMELQSNLELMTKNITDNEKKELRCQSPTLKRNNDLRFAQSRIFGVESQTENFQLQGLDKNKKKPRPRGVAKAFLKENNESYHGNVIVSERVNIYDDLTAITVNYHSHGDDFCI